MFIGNGIEDRTVTFSMKTKGQYSRIAFCVNLGQHLAHPFISYDTVEDVPF